MQGTSRFLDDERASTAKERARYWRVDLSGREAYEKSIPGASGSHQTDWLQSAAKRLPSSRLA
jgi:hypothetical protein